MKKSLRRLIGLLGASLALGSFAAVALTPGQKLSDAQIAQLGDLPAYDIGGSQIRVIPGQLTDNGATLLLNAQGIVGSSRNEIAITGMPADQIQAALKQALPQPLSVQ